MGRLVHRHIVVQLLCFFCILLCLLILCQDVAVERAADPATGLFFMLSTYATAVGFVLLIPSWYTNAGHALRSAAPSYFEVLFGCEWTFIVGYGIVTLALPRPHSVLGWFVYAKVPVAVVWLMQDYYDIRTSCAGEADNDNDTDAAAGTDAI